MYLGKISGQDIALPEPVTRVEMYLASIAGMDVVLPDEPVTRIEAYLAEWAEGSNIPWETLSGAIVSFIAPKAHALKQVVVDINPVQSGSGDPSPDNVRPISGWTEANVWDDSKYGGLIYFNQLVQNGDFSDGLTKWAYNQTAIVSDGVVTWETPGYYSNFYQININFASGHKYLATITVKTTEKVSLNVNGQTVFYQHQGSGEWETVGNIVTVASPDPSESRFRFMCTTVGGATTNILLKDAMVFDLTQMFGAGSEPSTVAEFEELFPHDYYPYNAGEETCVSAVNGDPYRHYQISFPDSAGTVHGGTLTINEDGSGSVKVTHKRYDEPITNFDTSSTIYFRINNVTWLSEVVELGSGQGTLPCMSNITKYNIYYNAISTNKVLFWNIDQIGQTVSEVLANSPDLIVQMLLPLREAVTYQLTAQQVISALQGYNAIWADTGDVTVTFRGTPVVEPEEEPLQALNLLLGNSYHNNQTPEDVSDEEALNILLGGDNR